MLDRNQARDGEHIAALVAMSSGSMIVWECDTAGCAESLKKRLKTFLSAKYRDAFGGDDRRALPKTVLETILDWSETRPEWQLDVLRRIVLDRLSVAELHQ